MEYGNKATEYSAYFCLLNTLREPVKYAAPSPGLKLLLSLTLLELIKGRASQSQNTQMNPISRLQITIPLMIP